MAITRRNATGAMELYGLSGDVKPTTFGVGSVFYETDTGVIYRWSGTAWFAVGTGGGGGGGGDASATNQVTLNNLTGSVTETAPATDTASSGLNGRLQRLAQRLTSLIALFPASLGQKARAASLAATLSTEDITALTVGVTLAALPAGTNNIGDVDIVSSVLPTGAATETTLAAQSAKLPAALGATTKAASISVALATDTKRIEDCTLTATGELAGATSATQGPSVTAKFVRFKARSDNTGSVYLGISGVTAPNGTTDTTSGLELIASEDTGWIPATNVSNFYRICTAAEDDLTYWVLT